MKKSLAVLAAAGGLAVGIAATANTASAQDYWNGGWHVGGDYYQPTDYGYGYGYLDNYAAPVGYSTIGMVAAPMQTVQTVTTVRTFRRTASAPRQIVTRRTTVSQLVAAPRTLYDYAGPAAAVAAPTYNTAAYYGSGYARPLYDYAYGAGYGRPLYDYAPAPAVAAPVLENVGYNRPLYNTVGYNRPLYDTVAPVVAAPISPAYYRYTYLWDRILVIDPQTGFLVRTLPR